MKTCSKESGARLVELGVERDSYFVWAELTGRWNADERWWCREQLGVKRLKGYAPAFTACELGEMLPDVIEEDGQHRMVRITKYNKRWELAYEYTHGSLSDTMPEAMALMLIWLLENGHLTKEEVNA